MSKELEDLRVVSKDELIAFLRTITKIWKELAKSIEATPENETLRNMHTNLLYALEEDIIDMEDSSDENPRAIKPMNAIKIDEEARRNYETLTEKQKQIYKYHLTDIAMYVYASLEVDGNAEDIIEKIDKEIMKNPSKSESESDDDDDDDDDDDEQEAITDLMEMKYEEPPGH